MTKRAREDDPRKAEEQRLTAMMDSALREAGVAEAVEAYEKAEAAYALIGEASIPAEFAAASTSDTLTRG